MGHQNLYEVLNGAMDDGTERGIRPGEYLLVEEGPVALEAGGLYLVETPGGLHLREVRREEGAWRFVPWDPSYPPFPLEAVRVVGRVRGVVQYEPLT